MRAWCAGASDAEVLPHADFAPSEPALVGYSNVYRSVAPMIWAV